MDAPKIGRVRSPPASTSTSESRSGFRSSGSCSAKAIDRGRRGRSPVTEDAASGGAKRRDEALPRVFAVARPDREVERHAIEDAVVASTNRRGEILRLGDDCDLL